jgi:hypothetical protein
MIFAESDTQSAGNTKSEEFVYPPEVQGIIDVTKAPYFADNTGKSDCTEVLIRAIDDMMREDHEAIRATVETVRGNIRQSVYHDEKRGIFTATELSFDERQRIRKENPQALIGFERCHGVFPARQVPAKILYFPNGTYLVSDTLVYSFSDMKNNYTEINRCMHFLGESQQATIIRLKDHAQGFDTETNKAVVSFTHGNWSNVAMQNSFQNFTIEVGAKNPGASGLEFFANNSGVIRNVTVRSLDPKKAGHAGLSMSTYNFSGVMVKNLTVDGFDYGVKVAQTRLYSVFENIQVSNQRVAGFCLESNNVSLRCLSSSNRVPAVQIKGQSATMALLEGNFSGGSPDAAAVECEKGFLFARDLKTTGYRAAIQHSDAAAAEGPDVNEYISHPAFTLFPDQQKKSLRLPIEETPEIPWDKDPKQWAGVDQFGARGDSFTDDTAAIQRAMNSGRSTVYFQPGTYLINGPIDVPASVRRIDMMYCDMIAGGDLQNMTNSGVFRIRAGSETLVMQNLFTSELFFGPYYLIDHASTRTLVLKDLHTQVGAMYRNSVPGGKVFIENVASTDQFEPIRNCFTFTGQKVWARQLNPERGKPEVLNEGSSLWVLGFKSEGPGCAFSTTGGGSTEVLNGIFNLWRYEKLSVPAIINDNSHVSVVASTTGQERNPYPYVLVKEVRGSQTNQLAWDALPIRHDEFVALPLYIGGNDIEAK